MQDFRKTLELIIEYIRGLWVKKRYIMICTWLICPIGFSYVSTEPDYYEASAKVFVDTRSVLAPMLRGLASITNSQQELGMMVKMLLTRPNVEIIARNADLDITTTTDDQFYSLVSSLMSGIKLDMAGRSNIYNISFRHRNPDTARIVVQETLELFVEGTLGGNRVSEDSANKFLDDQIAEYENRLLDAEQRTVNFQRKHSDLLPRQGSFYNNYDNSSTLLEQTRLTIKETEQKIASLSGQLITNKSQPTDSSVRPFDDSLSLTTRYDSRIKNLEEKLDQLMLKYTELHPDVIETNNLIDLLSKSRKQEIKEFFSAGNGERPSQIGSIANELKLEISRLESQVASLRVRESDFANKVEEYRQKIDLVPQAEAERIALDRDYNIIKSKHSTLLTRKDDSELSQKANLSSESVQFRVLESPKTPQNPAGSSRPLHYSAVLVFGFAVGLGLAFVISQLNPVLIKASQLTALTSYPVLGAVSHLNKAQILKVNRSRLMLFLLSSGIIVGMYGILMAAEIMKFNIYARIFS
ncbi:MAG: polysaccharide chain length determinant protein (PEP-CTERM system associated) [Oleiphilaceae bacterium]|jgi:polysaccharide chain length determinant protein (PEP-CTERM system associated)